MRSAKAAARRGVTPDHAHLGEGQDGAQAEELEAGLHARAEAGDHAGIGAGEAARGDLGGRPRPDGGEEAGLHEGQGRARGGVGEEVEGVDGGQAPTPVALDHGQQLGAESAETGQGRDHGQEDAVALHREHRPRHRGDPAGRALAEGTLHRRDDVPGGRSDSSSSRPRMRIKRTCA
jgi:hypothetical protein